MKNKYDVIVVGAGPAGSIAAKSAAENGVSVLLLEKDRDVGYPVRCAEAVRKASMEPFIEPDDKFIAAEISKFSFGAPSGTDIVTPAEQTCYVLERRVFDYELAKNASSAGAEVLTRAYVNGLLSDGEKVTGVKFQHRGEEHEVLAKVVIAADGVESRIGRWAGLKTHIDFREMESCVQFTVSNIDIDQETLYFYFGKEVAPEGYMWVFPKGNNSANVGLGVSGDVGKKKSALSFLNEFMERKFPGGSILTQVAGGVPCSITLDKISAPGIILVGDAARQVNPLSGGGITSGMAAGKIGGRIAAESIKKDNPNLLFNYDKEWNKEVGKRHEIYERLKNGIYKFSDEKFDKLADSLGSVPFEKRTMGNVFRKALVDQPSLLIDVAKVFFSK